MPSESILTLFIPDLFGFQSTLSKLSLEEISQLPKMELSILEKWLSRALFEKSVHQEDSLFLELGFGEKDNLGDNKEIPYAALSLLAEKKPDINFILDSYWLRADPVNLQPDRDTAVMAAHEELALTQEEADKLVAQINEHFIDEPWQLYTFAPHRWYLRLENATDSTVMPVLKTTPLINVLGDDISPHSPTGEGEDYWFKIINELQMLIHGSNVNFERESRNMWTANSVWLWGGGHLPKTTPNSDYDNMITNNVTYSGMGHHCGLDILALNNSASLDNTIIETIKTKNNVVILEMLSEQVQRRDLYTFVQTLNELENKLFKRCDELLVNRQVKEIKLITDVGIFRITKKQLGRWWKRTKLFSSLTYE